MGYSFDKDYFNEIDSAEKAYWIGFIWCDGYVQKRERRNGYFEYYLKIGLSEIDCNHLEKFKYYLNSNHPIKFYEIKSGFETKNKESRLVISNNCFCSNLYDNYGLVPHRFDSDLLIKSIPKCFYKYFIRGVFDAEGSIIGRDVEYKTVNRKEFSIGFSTYESILIFINKIFIKEGLTKTFYKLSKRHEDRDGFCKQLRITGNSITENILDWIYSDLPNLSMIRKYRKYLDLKEYKINYKREKGKI